MGIFDFLKKKKELEVIEKKKISYADLENVLNEEKENIRKRENDFFSEVDSLIENSLIEIDKKIEVLEIIDIESKKVEQRAKILVRQGLDKYLDSVRILKKDLNELNRSGINNFILNLNKVFSGFEKSSFLFYQRATYLIGDELANLKNEIVNLFKNIIKVFKNYEDSVRKEKSIEEIFGLISEIKSNEEVVKSKEIEIKKSGEKISRLEKRTSELEKEKEAYLLSSEHKKYLELKNELSHLNKKIEDKINSLKASIDFKKLASIYHSNSKDMEKVKGYKDNFREHFLSDMGFELLGLLKDTSAFSPEIVSLIEEIKECRDRLRVLKKEVGIDKSKEFLEEMDKSNLEIDGLKKEILNDEKRKNVLIEKNKEKRNEICGKIGNVGDYELEK